MASQPYYDIVADATITTSTLPNTTNESSSSSVLGYASVIYDFEARYADELSAKAGDSVKILEVIDENWAKCQHSASGTTGIMPQNFLQIFLEVEPNLLTKDNQSISSTHSTNGESSFPTETETIESQAQDIPWAIDLFPNVPKLQDNFFNNSPQVHNSSESLTEQIDNNMSSIHLQPDLSIIPSSNQSSLSTQSQSVPPKRPQPPNISSQSKFLLDESAQINVPQIVGPNRLPNDFYDQKSKVVQDLLLTETTYLFDLNSWETCISSSVTLSEENKRLLNNGFPHLKALSKKLIDNLQCEKAKPAEKQSYGQVLMQMKDDFYQTFSHHCRSVEKISQILENISNTELSESLNKCVAKMRKMGSNVFDVPTALSRPIHRCLKYPLYVSELLKNTPINHRDHPKLMEALKQLSSLASKMNECKRRKELIRKYTDEQQLTLTERLSRINIHSLVKKSNRLKYRISSTMGFNTIRDSEFDYLITQLDGSERRVCKFLYCAQLYMKNIEIAFKKYEDFFRGLASFDDERSMRNLCDFFVEMDKVRNDFLQKFNTTVLSEGRKLVRCDYTKLIHKRCDKLADYETAKAANKTSEIEMRRNEYEALNSQVKSGMPKLITMINKRVVHLVHTVHELDANVIKNMDDLLFKYRQNTDGKQSLFKNAQMFGNFVEKSLNENRFNELNRIIRTQLENPTGNDTVGADDNIALKVQGSRIIARRTASLKSKKNKTSTKFPVLRSKLSTNADGVSLPRPQTEKERDALLKITRAQGTTNMLRRVLANFFVDNLLLNAGDIVIIKSQHKSGKCLCDNGVALGYVSNAYLRPLDENESIDELLSPCNLTTQSAIIDLSETTTHFPSFRPASLPTLENVSSNQHDNEQRFTENWTNRAGHTGLVDFRQQHELLNNFDTIFAAANNTTSVVQAADYLDRISNVRPIKSSNFPVKSLHYNNETTCVSNTPPSDSKDLIDFSENLIDLG